MNETKETNCLICGTDNLEKLDSHVDRRKGLSGYWTLYKCKQCGVEAVYPSPSDVELSEYYSVYSHNKSVTFSLRTGSHHPSLRRLFHWISGDIDPRDFIKPEPNSTILDYGCGEAGCLFDFHSRGLRISGAEISSEMVIACQKAGLDVHHVTNPDLIPFTDESFNIVYLMQVFEHLRNPHVFFYELFRITKPGGMVYIAIPNSKSIWKYIFGKNWVSGWFVPFHLFHYDEKSFSQLANKHGFDVLKAWSRTPESWFRLNLKAHIYQKNSKLEKLQSVIDSNFVRFPLMLILRILEVFIKHRDCLVIKLIKPEPNSSPNSTKQ